MTFIPVGEGGRGVIPVGGPAAPVSAVFLTPLILVFGVEVRTYNFCTVFGRLGPALFFGITRVGSRVGGRMVWGYGEGVVIRYSC